MKSSKAPSNISFFSVGVLPGFLFGLFTLLYLLIELVFINRYTVYVSRGGMFIIEYPYSVLYIQAALTTAYFGVSYLVGIKKKMWWSLANLPLFILSFIMLLPLLLFFPPPNFRFAEECEKVNGKPFNVETVRSVRGYCVELTKDKTYASANCAEKHLAQPSLSGAIVNATDRSSNALACVIENSDGRAMARLKLSQ